eukprot:COSAG02_NODE_2282_length_9231_cov_3.148051_4_plen_172_part_00
MFWITICAIASICFCIFLKAIFSSNVALAGHTYETSKHRHNFLNQHCKHIPQKLIRVSNCVAHHSWHCFCQFLLVLCAPAPLLFFPSQLTRWVGSTSLDTPPQRLRKNAHSMHRHHSHDSPSLHCSPTKLHSLAPVHLQMSVLGMLRAFQPLVPSYQARYPCLCDTQHQVE